MKEQIKANKLKLLKTIFKVIDLGSMEETQMWKFPHPHNENNQVLFTTLDDIHYFNLDSFLKPIKDSNYLDIFKMILGGYKRMENVWMNVCEWEKISKALKESKKKRQATLDALKENFEEVLGEQ